MDTNGHTILNEDYCSYEVAKLLKEKGFNEECRGGYHSEFDDNDNPIVMFEEWTAQPYNNDFADEGFLCSAPTHQMAMKWLRKEHHILITIIPQEIRLGVDKLCYGIYRITEDLYQPLYNGKVNNLVDSYEEAIDEALKYTLINLI